MFLKQKFFDWEDQHINEELIEWSQEQLKNAEEMISKCERKSIGIHHSEEQRI